MTTDSRDPRAPDATPDARAAALPEEAELLRQARALLPAVDAEPRPGFAARVAARAVEQQVRPAGAPWWRWAFGGGALAAAAAALLLAVLPAHRAAPVELAANDRTELILRSSGGELAVAQRLELYEDLQVVQNEDALEDLDVVEALDQLEARP